MNWEYSNTRFLSAFLFFLLAATPVCAQSLPSVVSGRMLLATNSVHPGTTVKVAVVAHVKPGFHINAHKPSLDYLIPTKVIFNNPPDFKIEKVVYPQGKMKKFVFLDSPISVYEGEVLLGAVLQIGRSVKPGVYPIKGKFAYQACNDHACLPPTSAPLEIHVHVVPSTVPIKATNTEIFKRISSN